MKDNLDLVRKLFDASGSSATWADDTSFLLSCLPALLCLLQNITKAETYYYQHDIQKANQICQWCVAACILLWMPVDFFL